MARISSFLLGVAAGIMLCYAATNYHLVRANDGFHLIFKQRARLAEAYVDVRSFDVGEWSNHTELASAIVAAGKQYLMQGAVANTAQQSLNQLPGWSR